MATIPVLSDLAGTIQKYFEDSWMDRPQEDFRTPMANSEYFESAKVPPNSGQFVEFRKFDHFTIETNGTDDTPKTYAESATDTSNEPTTGLTLSSSTFRCGLEVIAHWAPLSNLVTDTDPTDLVRKVKDEFFLYVRRVIHRLTNDRCVKSLSENALSASLGTIMGASNMPAPLKTIFAGGVNTFGDLTADSVFTMKDLKRARSLLRNRRVPGIDGKMGSPYVCFICEAIKDQLSEDPEFRDIVKRHQDWAGKVSKIGELLAEWEGLRFVLQDDDYRCKLPGAGGLLTTRSDAGSVLVAHVMGQNALGYVDFGGKGGERRRTLRPTFKVQDITKTGVGPTIGWRMYYQACVTDRVHGLNIAGTSRWVEDLDDIV